MHSKIWRYLELEKKLEPSSFFSRLMLLGELVIHPIGHLLFWICFLCFPSVLLYFGYSEEPSNMKIAMYLFGSIQALVAMVRGWAEMFEYYNIGTLLYVTHIKQCRIPNPFVVRSATKSHQLFRYSSLLEYI
jgi:hypothetical protein